MYFKIGIVLRNKGVECVFEVSGPVAHWQTHGNGWIFKGRGAARSHWAHLVSRSNQAPGQWETFLLTSLSLNNHSGCSIKNSGCFAANSLAASVGVSWSHSALPRGAS